MTAIVNGLEYILRGCRWPRPVSPIHILRRYDLTDGYVSYGDEYSYRIDRNRGRRRSRGRLRGTVGEKCRNAASDNRDTENGNLRNSHTLDFPRDPEAFPSLRTYIRLTFQETP